LLETTKDSSDRRRKRSETSDKKSSKEITVKEEKKEKEAPGKRQKKHLIIRPTKKKTINKNFKSFYLKKSVFVELFSCYNNVIFEDNVCFSLQQPIFIIFTNQLVGRVDINPQCAIL